MKERLIWDIPTRLFHWLLVAGLGLQYVTAEWLDDAMQWHFYIGYSLLGLLIFRLAWGFVGPRYARFSAFVVGPVRVWRYASTILDSQAPAHAGHNPLGGWMVILMLAAVATQAISGLFLTDDVFLDGPWRATVDEPVQDLMSTLHHTVFDALLWFIGLHIIAIVFYTVVKKQRLVAAMVHGRKHTEAAPVGSSKLLLAVILALLAAGLTYYLVEIAPPEAPAQEVYY